MAIVLALVVFVLFFGGKALIKESIGAISEDAPKVLRNVTRSVKNGSDALPTMGSSFATQTVADSLDEVPMLKQKLGCDDPTVVTMSQLQAWMIEHNMF